MKKTLHAFGQYLMFQTLYGIKNYSRPISKRTYLIMASEHLYIYVTNNTKYIEIKHNEYNKPILVISLYKNKIYQPNDIENNKKIYFDNYPSLELSEENLKFVLQKI